MNIYLFYDGFGAIKDEAKKEYLHKLVDTLVDKQDGVADELLQEFLYQCLQAEEDDYFGTEGFNG